ncbi:MAG: outer membrane beta-barrel protein [Bacteroidota bacterium]
MDKSPHKNKRFSEKMRNFSKEPPSEIWEGIEEELQRKKKTPIIPVVWRYAAGILTLIGIGTAVFISNYTGEVKNQTILSEKKEGVREKTRESTLRNETNKYKTQENPAREEKKPAEIHKKAQEIATAAVQTDRSADLSGEIAVIPENKTDHDRLDMKMAVDSTSDSFITSIPLNLAGLPRQIKTGVEQDSIPISSDLPPRYTWQDLSPENFDENNLDKPQPEKARFTLTATVSPIYSYRDIGKTSSDINQLFNNSESGKFSYAGGINLGIKTGDKISLVTGIMYSRIGIEVNKIFAVTAIKNIIREDGSAVFHSRAANAYLINNTIGSIEQGERNRFKYNYSSQNTERSTPLANTGWTYLDAGGFYNPVSNYTEDDGKIDQYFQYLEIPFMLKYKIIEKKVDLNILGGLSTNFLIGNQVFYTQDNQSEYMGYTSDIQRFNYSGNLGLGLGYNIGQDISFLFEPQFKYYLNSINSETLIDTRPYSLGLYTGFLYQF